jgi:hypothetical protein
MAHTWNKETGELLIGGVFTDPAKIERLRTAMRSRWSTHMPHRDPVCVPRRYHPSILAHGTSSKLR